MRKFVVTIDGKNYEVGVEEIGADQTVVNTVAAPAAAPAAQAAPAAPAAPVSGEKVLSPFPGLIKKFLVNEGDTVKKDQPILVLEAMKMDNDITAPCAGKVSFKTAVGNNVETNALLAVIG
ncbi:MAG TPA: biotin/lipoyl-binding protein [Candidatus Borkfalkia faecipullorum]|uniref:Biotin/lipoyl-binding protein n=1 Tax=Candidatus Borkfalkia faecipullorum TaxID=2838510 RepID=A0A9D2AFV7_9FIRM|nr:biotin/lipoyl-binding protein [Candidatus Borkfalkia faecipullorum]